MTSFPFSSLPSGRERVSPLADGPELAGVWRAGELAPNVQRTLNTGYPALNAVLPGGGWPVGAMTELLQEQPGCGEWGLLSPALALLAPWGACSASGLARAASKSSSLVLVGSPYVPLGPSLAARQIDPGRLLLVRAPLPAARLWAAEQALRCAEVAAVLVWLPRVDMLHLRRLHMAAQAHGKLLFVFRPLSVQPESSPAPLRLRLERSLKDASRQSSANTGQGAAPGLLLHLFKRRGPPLAAPLELCTAPARLEALLAASRAQGQRRRQAHGPASTPPAPVTTSTQAPQRKQEADLARAAGPSMVRSAVLS
jgi:protein ImuA